MIVIQKKIQKNISVPEAWFTGLLELNDQLKAALESENKIKIMMAQASLIGYCNSALHIVQHSERAEE